MNKISIANLICMVIHIICMICLGAIANTNVEFGIVCFQVCILFIQIRLLIAFKEKLNNN